MTYFDQMRKLKEKTEDFVNGAGAVKLRNDHSEETILELCKGADIAILEENEFDFTLQFELQVKRETLHGEEG